MGICTNQRLRHALPGVGVPSQVQEDCTLHQRSQWGCNIYTHISLLGLSFALIGRNAQAFGNGDELVTLVLEVFDDLRNHSLGSTFLGLVVQGDMLCMSRCH